MNLNDVKKLNIPKQPGSYQFSDKDDNVLYVGKASDLRSRVMSYFRKSTSHTPYKYSMMKQVRQVKWIETDSEIEAFLLEGNLIKRLQPPYNIDRRDDKRPLYIKIDEAAEIPSLTLTRKLDKSGKYYGPYSSATAVKETLKAVRKIWPYCRQKKIKDKPCFYYQINRCLGVCGGIVDRQEYIERVIRPIGMFLEGRKKDIVRDIEKKIKLLERRGDARIAHTSNVKTHGNTPETSVETQDFASNVETRHGASQQIEALKYQLANMKYILEHTKIVSLGEKYAADVVELAKILHLPKVPERIEGYDISNIFGSEAVGSMVVFRNGEPDKNEYRKFKIKIGEGEANDVRMLREVLERRFKRSVYSKDGKPTPPGAAGDPSQEGNLTSSSPLLKKERDRVRSGAWPLPDLIIIDGGKAQRNVAVRVLKNYELDPSTSLRTGIPVLAISKGSGLRSAKARDKIFWPGEKEALELPLASPALHVIKRVRDEAHRFAISYHRLLRKKRAFRKLQ